MRRCTVAIAELVSFDPSEGMQLRRSWLVLVPVTLVTGTIVSLTAAQPAAVSEAVRQGGVLRVNVSETDIPSLDPALNYDVVGWQVQAATCVNMLNYPDREGSAGARLTPEVAAAMPRVSADGRSYTFTIRSGYRFNTGAPVTAGSFVRAIERALSPKLHSPGSTFVRDIAGAAAFASGRAKRVSGVRVSGNRVTIRLTAPAPDFLARIAMPFFCAVPSDFPIVPPGGTTPPSAGPFYIAAKTPNRSVTLRRNPFYGGPRPRRLDEIRFTVNTNLSQSYLQVQRGEADFDASGIPPSAHGELARKYGVNRGRYFVHPGMSVVYLAMNTSRPLFGDVAMRRAANFAIDRRALLRLEGANAGTPTDQILPPNMPGFRDARIYPITPNLARARKLAGGRTAKAILYTGGKPVLQNQAVLIQANLKQIGIDVEIRSFAYPVWVARSGKRGAPFDLNLTIWAADYPDPYDYLNVLLDGRRIVAADNLNWAYFDDPAYNRKLAAAAGLHGDARYRAYGALDVDIMRNAAPWVPLYNLNAREFISSRVGCYRFHVVWGFNLASACLR